MLIFVRFTTNNSAQVSFPTRSYLNIIFRNTFFYCSTWFFFNISQDLLTSGKYLNVGPIRQSIWHQERRWSILPPVLTSSASVAVLVSTLACIIQCNDLGCNYQYKIIKMVSIVFVNQFCEFWKLLKKYHKWYCRSS